MASLTDADSIRILVSTDNHVGYNERDPVRGDDSWRSFHEVMCLAREHDVDMVLLAGDLFHENKPSRKSMYQVMRSLRANCLGDKPCELEMLSDASENFQGAFNHVNYEDQDINVAIPVFSIHGNHDDPSGEGHLAALDILQVSGLINYYGRTPESDNIRVKPVLLQKGHTKLALYGISNVRDERLFRTFREGKVLFFQPSIQKDDWFNLICVHQNHHAHTETNYLPEAFLPSFLDLVIWGHEHECKIRPTLNPETNFHVMQPGSSVATSLVPGEALPKHVAILTITGREFHCEPIRLKTVRPFVMREIVLSQEKGAEKLSRKENNRTEVTRFLTAIVEELIEEAKAEWRESQELSADGEDDDDTTDVPLPLVRLRVEVSTPEGGSFDCENPQRFSNRFIGKVANVNDVVQFYRKKKMSAASGGRNAATTAITEEEGSISHLSSLDTVKVEKLVREILTAQALTILPQNSFSDAVSQFVDKDDKHAMEMFVNESLDNQVKYLMNLDRDADIDDEDEAYQSLKNAMDRYRTQMEDTFAKGNGRRTRGKKKRFKPRPDGWDSEFDGTWEDQPGALIHSDNENEDPDEVEGDDEVPVQRRAETTTTTTRGRGRGRGGRAASSTAASTRKTTTASTTKKTVPTSGLSTSSRRGRGRRPVAISDDEEEEAIPDEDEDDNDAIIQLDDDDDDEILAAEVSDDEGDDDSQALFVKSSKTVSKNRGSTTRNTRRTVPNSVSSTLQKQSSPAPSSFTAVASSTRRAGATRGAVARQAEQTTLSFQTSQLRSARRNGAEVAMTSTSRTGKGTGTRASGRSTRAANDEDEEEDDAFEPVPSTSRSRRR